MGVKKKLKSLFGENLKAVDFVKGSREVDEVKNLKKLFLLGAGASTLNNQKGGN